MKRSGNIYFGCLIVLLSASFAVLSVASYKKSVATLFYVFLAISAILLIVGVVNIVRWLLDARVRKYGEKSAAHITKVPTASEGNGLWQVGKTLKIEFEYQNADGKLFKGNDVVISDYVKGLKVGEELPILIYKNRAVIDYKSLQL